VDDEEDLQQLAQADARRVVAELHHLGMAGVAAAHLLVAGVADVAVAVAALDGGDAIDELVDRLEAPEAAAAERDAGRRGEHV
jgi:hypothetical protein